MVDELLSALKGLVDPCMQVIHNETGLKEFIVGGSWASTMIVEVVATVCCDGNDGGHDFVELVANDIDV